MSFASTFEAEPLIARSTRADGRTCRPEAVRLGQVIQQARKRAGLKQREVAARLGVDATAVAHWERGFAMPQLSAGLDLAQMLNIPFDQLLPQPPEGGSVVVTEPTLIEIVQALRQWPPEEQEAFRMVLKKQISGA